MVIVSGDSDSSLSEDIGEVEATPELSIHDSIISTLLTNDVSKDEPHHPYYNFDELDQSCDLGRCLEIAV
jgi:hypothetical protein